jgi:hypothetical protein
MIVGRESNWRLRSPGAGYRFGQQRMNSLKHFASFNAIRQRLPLRTLQTGTLNQIADFKIELML